MSGEKFMEQKRLVKVNWIKLTPGDITSAGAECRARYSLCQHKQSKIKSLSCKIGFGDSSPSLRSRFELTWNVCFGFDNIDMNDMNKTDQFDT